jgi:hypothetical protein
MRPILFLDIDDVLCVNAPYGGYDMAMKNKPDDLWEKLFAEEPKRVLMDVLERFDPAVVMTTSWLMFLEREAFAAVFDKTGLSALSMRFHEQWEAPWTRDRTRCDAIDGWLARHHRGEPYAILDDNISGTGLMASDHDLMERVVWCEPDIGLTRVQLPALERALQLRFCSLGDRHPDWKVGKKTARKPK